MYTYRKTIEEKLVLLPKDFGDGIGLPIALHAGNNAAGSRQGPGTLGPLSTNTGRFTTIIAK